MVEKAHGVHMRFLRTRVCALRTHTTAPLPFSPQAHVSSTVADQSIADVLDGYNSTVMAFGQT